jgi:hypothetical protein
MGKWKILRKFKFHSFLDCASRLQDMHRFSHNHHNYNGKDNLGAKTNRYLQLLWI